MFAPKHPDNVEQAAKLGTDEMSGLDSDMGGLEARRLQRLVAEERNDLLSV